MNNYLLEDYEWTLKIAKHKQVKGFFVVRKISKGIIDFNHPLNKDFAFCPSINFGHFLKQKNISELPDYFLFFNKSEIESLCIVTPVHS